MKVLEARSAFLSNYEVAAHLEQLTAEQDSLLKAGHYAAALESENLRTVQFELKAYLDEQPCKAITPEKLKSFLERLKTDQWHLTKVEKLMILNQVPGNEAEMSVLLEEYSERFPEDERQELMDLVEAALGRREETNGDADAEME